MTSKPLIKNLLISYFLILFVFVLGFEFNILSALLVNMLVYITIIPSIFEAYFVRNNIVISRVKIKYACYKSMLIIYRINFLLFIIAFLQLLYLVEIGTKEKLYMLLSLLPLLILNYIFMYFKYICVKVISSGRRKNNE